MSCISSSSSIHDENTAVDAVQCLPYADVSFPIFVVANSLIEHFRTAQTRLQGFQETCRYYDRSVPPPTSIVITNKRNKRQEIVYNE